jgi:arylsulfatase A
VEESGVADNTLFIFTSDNGTPWAELDARNANGHWANAPWRGQKGDLYEGGHRVPFLARWPARLRAGRAEDETICLIDLFATFAALFDIPLRPNMGEDSFNILPALFGEQRAAPLREATVYHSSRAHFAIRQGDWKLIENLGSGGFTQPAFIEPKPGEPPAQLYNLRDDPQETRNLWRERPADAARLQALLNRYRDSDRSRP